MARAIRAITLADQGFATLLGAVILAHLLESIEIRIPPQCCAPAGIEGEAVHLASVDPPFRAPLETVAVRRWDSYSVFDAEGRTTHDGEILFIDPVQCVAEIGQHSRISPCAGDDARPVSLPRFAFLLEPSMIIENPMLSALGVPIMYEPADQRSFRQYLPFAANRVMVRRKQGDRVTAATPFADADRFFGALAKIVRTAAAD